MIEKGGAILKIISILIIVMILLKLCLIFLWPFVVAILFVIFIEPLVVLIKSIGASRRLSVFICLAIVLLIVSLAFYYLSTYLYLNITNIIGELPKVIGTFIENVNFLKERNIDYQKIVAALEQFILTYKVGIFNTFVSTLGGAVYTLIIVINTIFFSLDLEKIDFKLHKLLPADVYNIGGRVIRKISSIMKIEVELVLSCTLQTILGLIILGEKDALTIGIICGILDLLPVVGPGMIFMPWVLYKILVHEYFGAIGFIFLYILIQVNREVLQIRLMGKSLRIHPVVTIFSIYVGLLMYGIWGVLLGPILFILFQELVIFYYEGRNI